MSGWGTFRNTGPTAISAGDAVVLDTTAAVPAVQHTTTVGAVGPVLVALQAIAREAYGYCQSGGLAEVRVTGSVSAYQRLQTSATAGAAQVGGGHAFATVLQAPAPGATTARVLLDVWQPKGARVGLGDQGTLGTAVLTVEAPGQTYGALTLQAATLAATTSGSGVAAPALVTATGGTGQATSDATNGAFGGNGGSLTLTGGRGGDSTATSGIHSGGHGGAVTLTAGRGGDIYSISQSAAGDGGALTLRAGAGGTTQHTHSNPDGGFGGDVVLDAGAGGDSNALQAGNPRAGGDVLITAGRGGNSLNPEATDLIGGLGGHVVIRGGVGGAVTPGGTTGGGDGGHVYLVGGRPGANTPQPEGIVYLGVDASWNLSTVSVGTLAAERLDTDGNRMALEVAGGTLRVRPNLAIGLASHGGGQWCIGIANAATVPTANPSTGGVLYAEGGALKWRSAGGTITTVAPN